jgi:ABC-type multidrug transport system permease subunit
MKKNIGNVDKCIRIIVATIIVGLYFANVITGTLGIVLLVVAGILVITSMTGFCLLYVPFGISTLKEDSTVNK